MEVLDRATNKHNMYVLFHCNMLCSRYVSVGINVRCSVCSSHRAVASEVFDMVLPDVGGALQESEQV